MIDFNKIKRHWLVIGVNMKMILKIVTKKKRLQNLMKYFNYRVC